MSFKVEIKTIPITGVCLDLRDDIFFRTFVLEKQKWDAWKLFANIIFNRKIKKCINKPRNLYASIKQVGQLLPVPVFKKNNKLYPLDGSTRISCLLALHAKKIKVTVYSGVVPQCYARHFQSPKYMLNG